MDTSAKIALFDIESTNLNADYGYILCISWKLLGRDRVHTIKISDSPTFRKDPTNDKYVVQKAAEELSKADVLVGWYSTKFDMPMIQSRLMYHELPVMPPIPHIDGWRVARYKMKLHSNRLASVQAFLGLPEKTPLSGPIWIKAMSGDKKAIKYVVEHCEQDVETLEAAYNRIKSLITNHPNVNLTEDHAKQNACPVCGAQRLHKRGQVISRTTVYQRYQCQKCGAWSRDKGNRIKDIDIR